MGVRLPSEYQEVEYIQGRITDNLSYIDTRYIPTVNTKVRVKFSPENINGAGYFGARFDPYRFYCVTFANGTQLSCGMTINAWPSTRLPLVFNDIYDATIANGQSDINGTVITTELIDASQWSDTVGTVQLKASGASFITPNSTAKYYLCQIWENNVLVRDFVPCYRKSDGEIGMYELVTREFYTNAGTSAFSKGLDVLDSISPLMVAWRRIMMAAASVAKKLTKLIATSTTGLVSFDTNVEMPTKVTCEFSPVQEGSGDPSPDNVRPISGWTGCGIFQAQKNLFNKNAQPYRTGGYINENAYVGGNLTSFITNNANYNIYALPVKPGQNYVFGIMIAVQPRMVAIDHDKKILAVYGNTGGNGYMNCLVPDSAEYLLFSVAINGLYKNIDEFQVELGSVHSTYEAYHGAEIPITFTDPSTGDPMTVYGGTVTLNEDGSADVVSEYYVYSITSSTVKRNYNEMSSKGVRIARYNLGSDKQGKADLVSAQVFCNAFIPSVIKTPTYNPWTCAVYYDGGIASFSVPSEDYPTESDFNNLLDSIGTLYIAYPLANPQTYHFANIGQLNSFLGTNNIWHNMNGDITVEYWNKQ